MLSHEQLQSAFLEACHLDVKALKPGNVSVKSAGHGMCADQFITSAGAAAPHIAMPALGVGEAIREAVRASWAATGCNTNLGIVLLCVPLAQAAMREPATHAAQIFSDGLRTLLSDLTLRDAELVFEAIRLASPGGLGVAPAHDVREPAQVTLLEAMRAAQDRDRIALQYVSGFADIFEVGVPIAQLRRLEGRAPHWIMTEMFLAFLSRFADTHVARKHGLAVALGVMREAEELRETFSKAADPHHCQPALNRWDADLKARGINPGTSADLAVASWFTLLLMELCAKEYP